MFIPGIHTLAQVDSMKTEGIKIVIPATDKTGNTYFFITTGYMFPSWCRVPMIPENPGSMKIRGSMNVKVPGWFAGIGLLKKAGSHIEAGLLADIYQSRIPVARPGQRSTSDWVYLQNNKSNFYTDIFDHSVYRKSTVISIRASIRYKIPVGKFRFWAGLAPGTFSSVINYSGEDGAGSSETYTETSLGLNFQTGIDFYKKDKQGKDKLRFTIFSDFFSPKIEERMFNLFNPGWNYFSADDMNAIHPFRLGFALGFH